ncbi:MAG: DUF1926 domain-containing protein, partial [Deltaproteobacteria bacterium]|nr:DUF1926 domain-containing protein [Deltaproteobacteria bacterium]
DGHSVFEEDIGLDNVPDVELRSEGIAAFIDPAFGGSIMELDCLDKKVNILNVLTRWKEGYHSRIIEAQSGDDGDTKSIHDKVILKEEGLAEGLTFDELRRSSLRDRIINKETTLEDIMCGSLDDPGGFYAGAYDHKVTGHGVVLSRKSKAYGDEILVRKELTLDGASSLKVAYDVGSAGGAALSSGVIFSVEFNVCLPGCAGPATYCEVSTETKKSGLLTKAVTEDVESVRIGDTYSGIELTFELSSKCRLMRYPIETVSLSEAGFEKNYQGTCFVFCFEAGKDDMIRPEINITLTG